MMRGRTSVRSGICSFLLVMVLTGVSLVRNSLWSDDLLIWGDTVRKSPNRGRPNYEYGKAWSNAGEQDVAFEYMRRARAIDPTRFSQGLGMAMERGVDVSVVSPHGGMQRGKPYRTPDPYAAIEQLVETGKIKEAIIAYEMLVEREPNNAQARNRLGRLYFIAKRPMDAAKELKKSIEIDPNLSAAHSNLGFIYMLMGNTEEAVAEFQEAMRLDPRDAEPRAKLGQTYLRNGQTDDAIREFEQALRMDPKNKTALSFLPQARRDAAKKLEANGQTRPDMHSRESISEQR